MTVSSTKCWHKVCSRSSLPSLPPSNSLVSLVSPVSHSLQVTTVETEMRVMEATITTTITGEIPAVTGQLLMSEEVYAHVKQYQLSA